MTSQGRCNRKWPHHGEQVTSCGPAAAVRDPHTISGRVGQLGVVNRHLATSQEQPRHAVSMATADPSTLWTLSLFLHSFIC